MEKLLEVQYNYTGDSKNCYIFEPEEGGDAVGKLYVRKSVLAGPPPASVMVAITEIEDD